jgi:hypothetical protein
LSAGQTPLPSRRTRETVNQVGTGTGDAAPRGAGRAAMLMTTATMADMTVRPRP